MGRAELAEKKRHASHKWTGKKR